MEKVPQNNIEKLESFETLHARLRDLEEEQDKLLEPYEKLFIKKRATKSEERHLVEKELDGYMESIRESLSRIKDEKIEIRKKLTFFHWKQLADDYRKITQRRDELYSILNSLSEGDSKISSTEGEIEEIERQLIDTIKQLNSEGIKEEEVKAGKF